MAFLAPYFAPDVFVSYSHGDPRGVGNSQLKRWTTALIHALTDEINCIDPDLDTLNIWFDERIDPTAHLTQELRDKVKESGILLVVMSPRYLASSWCRDELEWFRQQISDRSRDQRRVFVIRAVRTNDADWPDFLRDERGHSLPGFVFHDRTSAMPYGWADFGEKNGEFRSQLWTLRTELTGKLRELRERAELRAATPTHAIPQGANQLIYLHARAEYSDLRKTVWSQLEAEGLKPLATDSQAGSTLKDLNRESKVRIEAAKRCGAMALVRADGNENFIGDLLGIGVDERERIQLARGAPIPCAVLDGSGENLPIDISSFGIKRFDVGSLNWRSEFRTWLAASQAAALGAA